MVAADAIGAVEGIGGEKVASSIKAASGLAMDAGGKVGDLAGGTAGLLASGIKDNVQLLDSVSRATVGNVGKALALGGALHEGGGNHGTASAPADAAHEAAAAEEAG